jgi:2-iminobutanoate/2-iminopropanoate deaminase
MTKKIIKTDAAPAAIGPYSQAIVFGDLLYTAGQIGLDPKTGNMVEGGVKEQAVRVLENLKAVLVEAGCDLGAVVKTTVYLIKSEDFPAVNEIYGRYFNDRPPARTTVFVSGLPKGALIEIEAVARL